MKMMLASTPPAQYDGIGGSSTSGVASGNASYHQSTAGSTMSLLLPHIHKAHHQLSQQPTPYFGLSVISAPAPFAQRSTAPLSTGSDQSSSVGVGGAACRVGSGGGFRGSHRPIPLKTVAPNSWEWDRISLPFQRSCEMSARLVLSWSPSRPIQGFWFFSSTLL